MIPGEGQRNYTLGRVEGLSGEGSDLTSKFFHLGRGNTWGKEEEAVPRRGLHMKQGREMIPKKRRKK